MMLSSTLNCEFPSARNRFPHRDPLSTIPCKHPANSAPVFSMPCALLKPSVTVSKTPTPSKSSASALLQKKHRGWGATCRHRIFLLRFVGSDTARALPIYEEIH